MRMLARVCVGLLSLGVLGCGSTDDAPKAEESRPSATPTSNNFADFVTISGGRKLYVECKGEGAPTILLESGDESDIGQWSAVMDSLAEQSRTCGYERLGVGASDPATGCREMDDLLNDLEEVLAAAKINGPFVTVGTSGGGFIMAAFAARHPEQIKGMVFAETPKAITILPPVLKKLLRCDAPTNIERRDYVNVEHAAWDHRKRLGTFPLTVISNRYAPGTGRGDEETNVKDQRGWFVLSPNAKQVVVTTGHDVASNEYGLVIKETLEVLATARGG